MLSPKKVKWRKPQKGRMKGKAYRGSTISYGEYALQATTCGYITNRQLEAARIAISRRAKRGGKLWIKIFPDKALTKKPAEVRMGKGKGAPDSGSPLLSLEEYFLKSLDLTAKQVLKHCDWRGTNFRF